QDPALLTLLGQAALARGDRAAARRHLTAAVRLDPSVAAHLAFGLLERKAGNLEAAAQHLKEASGLDPAGTTALVALGDLYLAMGQKAEAEATIRAAVARDPLNPAPAAHLGQLAFVANDRPTAEAWFTQALASDPRWHPALEGLTAIRSKDGRTTARLKALLDRPTTVDDAVRKAVRTGRASLEKGLLKRAREQFEKAARLDGEHPGAWAGLGRVHEREERFDLAALAYIKALSSPDPLPPAVRNRLLQWVASRRHPDAFQPILKRFLHATDEGERQRAALALGALGDRRVVPLLVDHLERHPPPVQAALAEALGRLGDPAAAKPLERLAATSQDEDVRSAVERALAQLPAHRTR
ncbi:MAG: HEAT repeat domain-containing protein, partial [Candidatus Tectimicrobiota bacterium]